MTDRRRKNANWQLHPNADGSMPHEDAKLAVLMDIRDELQSLNRILQCPNFIAVPRKLDDIKTELRQVRLNTRKKKRPKVMTKPKLTVVR